jgi:hypothetical protein
MVKERRLGPGMPFLDSDTCKRGGEGGYLFLPEFSSLSDGIHGWMTGRMDEKSFRTTTSFIICNTSVNPVPNAQVCYFNNVWFML